MFQKTIKNKAERAREVPRDIIIGSCSTTVGSCLSAEKIFVFGKVKDSIIKCNHLIIFSGGSVTGLVYYENLEVHNGGFLDAKCFLGNDIQFVPEHDNKGIKILFENLSIEKNTPIGLPAKNRSGIIEHKSRTEKKKQKQVSTIYNDEDEYAFEHSILGDIESNVFRYDRFQ